MRQHCLYTPYSQGSAPGRKGSHKARIIRLILGLADRNAADEPLPPWSTQVDIAKRLAPITQATVSRHHVAAIKEWAATPWLDSVRDELVSIVSSAGRIMTSLELAAAFRAHRGAADQDTEQALAKAMAVVRAAVEAETWTGPGQKEDHEPRLAILRRGARVLIAMESLPGTNDPSPRELADYALDLGNKADVLAAQDPLRARVKWYANCGR